jgi:transglutaminase-like putative cysteine protease
MHRHVGCLLELDVHGPVEMALQIAVAEHSSVTERLSITLDGVEVAARELATSHAGRMHALEFTAGRVVVDYSATIAGTATPAPVDRMESFVYLRPSRYAPSDRLGAFALTEFGGINDRRALLDAVSSWVGTRLGYVPGSSTPTDGAIETLMAGQGVCRDYAHLVVALLRALDVPARVVAVYAPGLTPMDFHAVAEAVVDDAWRAVDATLLAPRSSLVRIATGRDAADTAFVSSYGAHVDLISSSVFAYVDGQLPADDVSALVSLS